VKVGVSEMNATETKVSVRLEAPLESFDRSRSALLASVAKYLRK
jgi:hypothetical protein